MYIREKQGVIQKQQLKIIDREASITRAADTKNESQTLLKENKRKISIKLPEECSKTVSGIVKVR